MCGKIIIREILRCAGHWVGVELQVWGPSESATREHLGRMQVVGNQQQWPPEPKVALLAWIAPHPTSGGTVAREGGD
jgi:hypothetical protein